MTQPSHAVFCGHCGTSLPPTQGFCHQCGAKRVDAAAPPIPDQVQPHAPAAPAAQPAFAPAPASGPARERSRLVPAIAIGAGLALAVGGGIVAVSMLGGGSAGSGKRAADGSVVVRAVTKEPTLLWTERLLSESWVIGAGERFFVANDAGVESYGVDEDTPRWSTPGWYLGSSKDVAYVVEYDDAGDEHVVTAADAETGDELWTLSTEAYPQMLGDDILLDDSGRLSLHDTGEEGAEKWVVRDVSQFQLADDGAFMVALSESGSLRGVDVESGEVLWEDDVRHNSDMDALEGFQISGDLIVLAFGNEIEGWSTDGEHLFTEPFDRTTSYDSDYEFDDTVWVTALPAGKVAVTVGLYDDYEEETDYDSLLVGPDGIDSDLDLDASYGRLVGPTGSEWIYLPGEEALLDTQLDRIAEGVEAVTWVDGGAYLVEDGEVRFLDEGGEPGWELQVPGVGEGFLPVTAAKGRVLVTVDDELRIYG